MNKKKLYQLWLDTGHLFQQLNGYQITENFTQTY